MTELNRPRVRAATHCVLAIFATAVLFSPAGAQQTPDRFPPSSPQAPEIDLPALPKKEEKAERFGDWVKKCETRSDNKRRCFLNQVVIHQKDDKRRAILLVAIGHYGEKNQTVAILRVPLALGPYLPAGMILNVPTAKPVRVIFENCLPGGCSGVTALDNDTVEAMKKAIRGTVEVQNLRKQKLQLPVSFKGFTAGLAALRKE